MSVLKNIGYTVLSLACIVLAFVTIPVVGFICIILLATAGVVFLAYFIYTGVTTLQEMNAELKKEVPKERTP